MRVAAGHVSKMASVHLALLCAYPMPHTHSHTETHTQACRHTYRRTHGDAHTHWHTGTHTRWRTDTRASSLSHTHTLTHAHTHTRRVQRRGECFGAMADYRQLLHSVAIIHAINGVVCLIEVNWFEFNGLAWNWISLSVLRDFEAIESEGSLQLFRLQRNWFRLNTFQLKITEFELAELNIEAVF